MYSIGFEGDGSWRIAITAAWFAYEVYIVSLIHL